MVLKTKSWSLFTTPSRSSPNAAILATVYAASLSTKALLACPRRPQPYTSPQLLCVEGCCPSVIFVTVMIEMAIIVQANLPSLCLYRVVDGG